MLSLSQNVDKKSIFLIRFCCNKIKSNRNHNILASSFLISVSSHNTYHMTMTIEDHSFRYSNFLAGFTEICVFVNRVR